jgi:hypothetical protein
MITLDQISKVGALVLGAIGAALGIYNFIIARRKEARERSREAAAQRQSEREWGIFNLILSEEIYAPKPGSEDHRICESLFERGRLQRIDGGYYIVPQGQIIKR